MSEARLYIPGRIAPNTSVLVRSFDPLVIPPQLLNREVAPRRTKIWEFSTHLHCSIIGTCLSTAELRHVLRKFGLASQDSTDHELHGVGVTLAGRHDDAGRHLHKALDHRHKLAVSQFAKAASEDNVRAMWRDAVRRGEIPGAYWATLTHPLTTQALVREAFGEVHMLSHLVGSANRADIRRLCVLEAEKAALEVKVERQQQALHSAVVSRDVQIKELRQALVERVASSQGEDKPEGNAALYDVISDLERRLVAESRRRAAAEAKADLAQSEADRERSARLKAEQEAGALYQELRAIEVSLAPADEASEFSGHGPAVHLDGIMVLYVGGRPNQIAAMRAAVERVGATFAYHDGGVENHPSLLPGIISRSDIVVFPVDCISHDAAHTAKSLCRQTGKRFVPLRSSSVTSLMAALLSLGANRGLGPVGE